MNGMIQKQQMIDAAVKEADEGIFISQAAMNAWVDSWGTDNELAPPKPDIRPNSVENELIERSA